jgi:threonine dehydrogenase-like Zn-dependent dehydrogenase
MRAMSVIPGKPDSAEVSEFKDPPEPDGSILVEGLLIGICGTDMEIMRGYGEAPPGHERLVIGHESLGRVIEAPAETGFAPGDLVAGVVRRPDPVPCPACEADHWDFCENGQYTERGIKGHDGYGSTRWRIEPRFAIPVPAELGDLGVLTEPASVVAKAWQQIDTMITRAPRSGKVALVVGAGPIGLLAALLGRQRGYEVHVLDKVTSGPKPELVAALEATYHHGRVEDLCVRPDVVVECTGVGEMVIRVARRIAQAAVLCLAGISSGKRSIPVNMDKVNEQLVLENGVVFGTVNASRLNYTQAVEALTKAERQWLSQLISRVVPLSSWPDALTKGPDDVKVVVDLRE